MESFKNFDQNTGGKCNGKYIWWFWNSLSISIRILLRIMQPFGFFPVGKVDKFQGKIYHQNPSIRWQLNFYGILQEFWSECWWETLVANTQEFWIPWAFRSKFCFQNQNFSIKKNYAIICFCLDKINFKEEDVVWILQKIRLQNFSKNFDQDTVGKL